MNDATEYNPNGCQHLQAGRRLVVESVISTQCTVKQEFSEALVRCEDCDQYYWLKLLADQPGLRRYQIGGLQSADAQRWLRNRESGSCDIQRAQVESDYMRSMVDWLRVTLDLAAGGAMIEGINSSPT